MDVCPGVSIIVPVPAGLWNVGELRCPPGSAAAQVRRVSDARQRNAHACRIGRTGVPGVVTAQGRPRVGARPCTAAQHAERAQAGGLVRARANLAAGGFARSMLRCSGRRLGGLSAPSGSVAAQTVPACPRSRPKGSWRGTVPLCHTGIAILTVACSARSKTKSPRRPAPAAGRNVFHLHGLPNHITLHRGSRPPHSSNMTRSGFQ